MSMRSSVKETQTPLTCSSSSVTHGSDNMELMEIANLDAFQNYVLKRGFHTAFKPQQVSNLDVCNMFLTSCVSGHV